LFIIYFFSIATFLLKRKVAKRNLPFCTPVLF
jgi:hypothetical protein